MDFNLVTSLESCFTFIKGNPSQIALVYYSHIPAALISLLVGLFVFLKRRNELIGKLLLAIAISFSAWTFLNLIIWTKFDSRLIMFSWSLLGIFNALIYVLGLYFFYVFIDKKDMSVKKKIILGFLLLPIIIFTSTKFNLTAFDSPNCQATEWSYFPNYYYALGLLISIWVLILTIFRYVKADRDFRKQILLMAVGLELFLLSFFITGFLNSYLVNVGYITDVVSYRIELYGLFGMTIFMGFLAFLIVRYHAFNIKLIATQALVAALVILIGSELFFAESTNNQILILITLAISLGFGYILIKSVKLEVERKEQLQIMSNKLAVANDQLVKLDNAKTEFISIASHQLRTPLTAVKGFISLLLEGSYGKLQKKHEEVLNKVYISNERLINLVEDLLNISRIESGRMEYKFEKWDIVKMCSELVDTFVFKAKDRGLYIHFKKPEHPLPEVTTDGAKIREVISNLIDNAIKYSQKGGVSIRIEKISNFNPPIGGQISNNNQNSNDQNQNANGDAIRVSISDTGIGIPATELPYLFSKFSRGKDVNRLSVGGTGLGLYVGRSIMEAISGKIWVESEGAGKGSRFIVEVPVEKTANIQ